MIKERSGGIENLTASEMKGKSLTLAKRRLYKNQFSWQTCEGSQNGALASLTRSSFLRGRLLDKVKPLLYISLAVRFSIPLERFLNNIKCQISKVGSKIPY